MTARSNRRRIVVLSRWWQQEDDPEAAFVVRSIAAGLSRHADVEVLVPGTPRSPRSDGLFDLQAIGGNRATREWPHPSHVVWPDGTPPEAVVIESGDVTARRIAAHFAATSQRFVISPNQSTAKGDVPLVPSEIGIPVPVSPMARARPHNGFGFSDYLLVLTNRHGSPAQSPPPLAAWLAARFPRSHLVLIDNAIASAWRSRSLRGQVPVDSRTDLQRLIAHARVLIDLAPGHIVARECIEALRYGTPLVVPRGTVGSTLAAWGGGLSYSDVTGLFACVDAIGEPSLRNRLSRRGQAECEARHGDPMAFVEKLRSLLLSASDSR